MVAGEMNAEAERLTGTTPPRATLHAAPRHAAYRAMLQMHAAPHCTLQTSGNVTCTH